MNYSFEKVSERLKRKPTLHGHRIEALPAYLTSICIVIQPSEAKSNII